MNATLRGVTIVMLSRSSELVTPRVMNVELGMESQLRTTLMILICQEKCVIMNKMMFNLTVQSKI